MVRAFCIVEAGCGFRKKFLEERAPGNRPTTLLSCRPAGLINGHEGPNAGPVNSSRKLEDVTYLKKDPDPFIFSIILNVTLLFPYGMSGADQLQVKKPLFFLDIKILACSNHPILSPTTTLESVLGQVFQHIRPKGAVLNPVLNERSIPVTAAFFLERSIHATLRAAQLVWIAKTDSPLQEPTNPVPASGRRA